MNTKSYIFAFAGTAALVGGAFTQEPDVNKIKADAESGNSMAVAQSEYAMRLVQGDGIAQRDSTIREAQSFTKIFAFA